MSDDVSLLADLPGPPALEAGGSSYSRFAQRLRLRYTQELDFLPAGWPDEAGFSACFEGLQRERGLSFAAALRVTRNLVLERLLRLDCDEAGALQAVMRSMTLLAQWALALAFEQTRQALLADGMGAAQTPLWVVGMGKLGAWELNVSSDIDLIFVYHEEGDCVALDGQRSDQVLSHSEYFQKWVRAACQALSEVTEHGFVFRVDLALRPYGSGGLLALSLATLEEYLQASGRPWERLAWLKARVVAGWDWQDGGRVVRQVQQRKLLQELVRPFVYRRYLDYSALQDLRQLREQIRSHVASRSGAQQGLRIRQDIKLGPGGIRELEFTVQALQLVRGGQSPALRVRGSLQALERLAQAQIMPRSMAQALGAAYVFLRRLEHRIQYLDDLQTHTLPSDAQDLHWLALSLGFAETAHFLEALKQHQDLIAKEFDAVLTQNESDSQASRSAGMDGLAWAAGLSGEQAQMMREWRLEVRLQALPASSAQHVYRLLARSCEWIDLERVPLAALPMFLDWLAPLLRRESYLSLLLERPKVHERLLRMLTLARWPARFLMRHPAVIDELADESILHQRFDAGAFEGQLDSHWRLLGKTGEASEETAMALLRQAQQVEVFRILIRDMQSDASLRPSVQEVADDLSALADAVLRVSLRWAWPFVSQDDALPQIALIAYGKLGGKELGYGSDLDLVCLYDDSNVQAEEAGGADVKALYAKLLRKIIAWLTTPTAQGKVYEIDTALRPNGNAGLLVSSITSFEDYQSQRGSNSAWTWEHQAMTRARCAVGAAALAKRFEMVREQVLCAQRDASALRDEIVTMRLRVLQAQRIPEDAFDIKHSRGGMMDVEFVVQYLVLRYAAQYPELRANSGNIALLNAAQSLNLLPEGVGTAAAQAYASLRQMQHVARLDERGTRIDLTLARDEQAAVLALWAAVMETPLV